MTELVHVNQFVHKLHANILLHTGLVMLCSDWSIRSIDVILKQEGQGCQSQQARSYYNFFYCCLYFI